MRPLADTQVHAEILGLIDRAQRWVVLVSPFVRPWPALRTALGRAVQRGVDVQLYTRAGSGGPRDVDLEVFDALDIPVRRARRLHQKQYLSEAEALSVSANLVGDAVDRAVEGGFHFSRETDGDAWRSAFEIWLRTRDACERDREDRPPTDKEFTAIVEGAPPEPDGYCAACGTPGHGEVDLCLPCRAAAVTRDQDPWGIRRAWCPTCGEPWPGATVERPLCPRCYRAELDSAPAWWLVEGQPGAVDAWWTAERESSRLRPAIGDRMKLWLADAPVLAAELDRPTRARLDALDVAFDHLKPQARQVFVERRPPQPTTPPSSLAHVPATDLNHVSYRAAPELPISAWWVTDRTLTTFDLALPPPPTEPRRANLGAFWALFLAARAAPSTEPLPPDRTLLSVDLHLTMPEAAVAGWWGHARELRQTVLAALHPLDAETATSLVATLPERLRAAAVARLTQPGVLGAVPHLRDRGGKLRELGARPDRVAVHRLTAQVGADWRVVGQVTTVRPRPAS